MPSTPMGQFVAVLASFIMFVASLITVFYPAVTLFQLTRDAWRDYTIFAHVDSANSTLALLHGLSIYLMVLAAITILSTFCGSQSGIVIVGVIAVFNVIAGVTILSRTSDNFASAQSAIKTQLIDYQSKYDWDHNKLRDEVTQVWDNLQTTAECCGLSSPDDWKAWRPKGLGDDLVPISCCQAKNETLRGTYCDTKKEAYWTKGCESVWDSLFKQAFSKMVNGLICSGILLPFLAVIVCCCGKEPVIVRWK